MKAITQQKLVTWIALLLSLPTGYFILINLLNDAGISGPYDAIDPFLQSAGIREPLGWNINLLILLGPVAALLLTIFQLLIVKWSFTKEHFEFHFTVKKRWFSILVAAFSVSLMTVLFLYLVGENCNCKY